MVSKMENRKQKNRKLKNILMLQGIIILYSVSSVVAKLASKQETLSNGFILLYGLEVAILGVYAILWQQAIKKFELSIAYANRAMVVLWSMVWAVLLFDNRITPLNAAGLALIVAGTVILNREERGEA